MGVGVVVAVAVEVPVGVGVPVCRVNPGVGEAGAEDEAERDGDGLALAEADEGTAGGAAPMAVGVLVLGDTPGDAPPADPASAVAEALAVPGGRVDRPPRLAAESATR